jgi:hypothetical protein
MVDTKNDNILYIVFLTGFCSDGLENIEVAVSRGEVR